LKNSEAKEDILKKEEDITKKLAEMKHYRDKMLRLFAEDMISLEELQEKLAVTKTQIPKLEYELKTLSIKPNQKAFEKALDSVFQNIESITDIRTLSNAQLKKIIQKITVDKEGHVDIYLNLL
jgi:hypothetical protein